MLICDTIKKRRRRGPRVVYVEKLGLSKRYQTVLRRAGKESDKYFFKKSLKFGKSVQKKVVKLYYRKIKGNGDLLADDRASQQLQQHVLLFKKTFPVCGVSLYFLKIFRFGGSIPPVRLARFSNSSLATFLYSILFFSVSPYSFLGRLFFGGLKERKKES